MKSNERNTKSFHQLELECEPDTVYSAAELLDRVMADDDLNDLFLAELQKRYGGNHETLP